MTDTQLDTNGLVPPDPDRCQVMKPNGNSFMTLGGQPGLERCTKAPAVIVTENIATAPDGKRGYMSMCDDCLNVFFKQMPDAEVTIWRYDPSQYSRAPKRALKKTRKARGK